MRKIVSSVMLTLILISMLTMAFNVKPAKAEWTGTVYIRADGSIDPPDAPIITYDKITYTLTDNIMSSGYYGIVVERDNIIIDGAGYIIQGTKTLDTAWVGIGIDLSGRINVTVRNTQIRNFWCGIRLYYSKSNTVSGNDITDNYWDGILLASSSNNIISKNNVTGAAQSRYLA